MHSAEDHHPHTLVVMVLREVLVALDIEMTIRKICAGVQIILANSADEAAILYPEGRISAVFVQMNAADYGASPLSRRVTADGGKAVLVGYEPVVPLPQDWRALPFPFAEQDLSALLV